MTVGCLAALAFVLSYSALKDLAAAAGVAPRLTWLWPLVVDGNIVINEVVPGLVEVEVAVPRLMPALR